ncbi:MAG: discoidin domain-containing protein, partial [Phaeodactylibacter sp.]|nr:discoidin domain-containing protein [Phaeodactylibacter sp.]
IATVVLSALLYLGHYEHVRVLSRVYPFLWWGCGITLLIAGHYGGAMTHGTDYLFERPATPVVVADLEEAMVYDVVIQPIFDQKCTSCHKPSKSKGGLILTDKAGILAGGDSGAFLNTDLPAKSLLIERIHLPMEVEEHMPPEGKPQLSSGETQLLEWWLANEACFDCKVKDTKDRESVEAFLDALSAPADHWAKLDLPVLPVETIIGMQRKGLSIQPVAEDSPFLLVDASRNSKLSANSFRQLKRYGAHVLEWNGSGSNFSDELAPQLAEFSNLKKLSLQRTSITDEGLSVLPDLEHLQSLNLYGTNISAAGLQWIAQLPNLKQLYLWQTDISEEALADWMASNPDVQVQREADRSIFGTAALNPPLIEASSTLFNDSIVVRAISNFKGVNIHYTLDGTEPDANAPVFVDSVILHETAEMKAFAAKEGWQQSEVASARFMKAGLKPVRGTLLNEPSGKFQGEGGQSLIDLQKGTVVFTAGSWLGYEGKHMEAIIELAEKTEISEVTLSALSHPASWIFYPKSAVVSVSSDGKNFREVARQTWASVDKEVTEAELKYLPVEFEPIEARYVKVDVKSPLKNPDWHPNPGGKSWIFIDEVLLSK